MTNFNQWLWSVINEAGEWWWIPCWLLALKNMVWLSNMTPARTFLGRTARVFAWLAHLCMLFSPMMASLRNVMIPLILISSNALYIQLWLACRKEGQGQCYVANPRHMARKVLRSMVTPE